MINHARPASVSTLKDGSVSIVFHVPNDYATEGFALHPYLDTQVRLDIWED